MDKREYKRVGFHPHPEGWGLPADEVKIGFMGTHCCGKATMLDIYGIRVVPVKGSREERNATIETVLQAYADAGLMQ